MEKEYKEEASLFSTILAEQNSKEQMVCVKAGWADCLDWPDIANSHQDGFA